MLPICSAVSDNLFLLSVCLRRLGKDIILNALKIFSSMSSPLLTLPLELREQIFSAVIFTPHIIEVSLSNVRECHNPIEHLSTTCKQLQSEITSWSSLASNPSSFHVLPFGTITPHTTITFCLSLRQASIRISKIPQNLSEVAIFQLWHEIMVKLNTCEMEMIDREIRDRFDMGDEHVKAVLEGVYEDIVDKRWAEDVRIYGGNRYLVIATWFWGRNRCQWKEVVLDRV
ncbi:hypothetical protein N431DRAFT_356986 [Stipitochalara longipes BDJ]|nr:hypothetical protein N431DRAFT_356986 [Stipitochalara longipes BDJ]